MNHGVLSSTRCRLKTPPCRRKAAVKYAMLPAYFVVTGSAQSESVEAQLSFVRLRICTAIARKSGGNGRASGRSVRTFTSSTTGVPIVFRYGLKPVVETYT